MKVIRIRVANFFRAIGEWFEPRTYEERLNEIKQKANL